MTSPPRFQRLEGDIDVTSGGVTSHAKIMFQAPDQLRIDVAADPAALISPCTVIAKGDETRRYDLETKRIQRMPYNITKAWWRGWGLQSGGPANFLLWGWSAPAMATRYRLSMPDATTLHFDEVAAEGHNWRRDLIRFGGQGNNGYYAAMKRLTVDWPAAITIGCNDTGKTAVSRIDEDPLQRLRYASSLSVDAATGLPTKVETRDISGAVLSEFIYSLKQRTDAFPDTTFQTAEDAQQIAEDLPLGKVEDYENKTDADSQYNLGCALAGYAEDYPAAFQAWSEAVRLKPGALAPFFALYDTSMSTRDFAHAGNAVDALAHTLGEDSLPVATRRANLLAAQRNWSAMAKVLDSAQAAQPGNLDLEVLRAELADAMGDIPTGRTILLAVVGSLSRQPDAQATAATLLSRMLADSGANAAGANDTQWQRLANAMLALDTGKPYSIDGIVDPLAKAAWVNALKNAGKFDDAIALCLELKMQPEPLGSMAVRQLVALYAVKGSAMDSLNAYRELMKRSPVSESATEQIHDLLLDTWQKGFGTKSLRHLLEQRILSTTSVDDDWRLWLAFQERNGSADDITSVVQQASDRFSTTAWWQSRLAEDLMAQGGAVSEDRRTFYVGKALKAVQLAIDDAPDQSYYQVQRALIMTQSGVSSSPIVEGDALVRARQNALDNLETLRKRWPDDIDIKLAVALQQLVLELPGNFDPVVAALQDALHHSAPGTSGDDGQVHQAASAARQAMASALRQHGKPAEAATQYELLLAASRDADEELGLSRNYLLLFAPKPNASDPQIVAHAQASQILMLHLVHEPWPYDGYQTLVAGFVNALLENPKFAAATADLLAQNPDPYAHLAEAHLRRALAYLAGMMATAADPPANAETLLQDANNKMDALMKTLEGMTTSDDHLLAGRAAQLLADDAMTRADAAAGAKWFKLAAEREPRDEDLQFALANALVDADLHDQALAVRQHILQGMPLGCDTLRRLGALSSRLQMVDAAEHLGTQAMNSAQTDPDISPAIFQACALTRARALFIQGQHPRATEIYNDLASDQWDYSSRLAALVDQFDHLRAANDNDGAVRVKAQVDALAPSNAQLREAHAYLLSLN